MENRTLLQTIDDLNADPRTSVATWRRWRSVVRADYSGHTLIIPVVHRSDGDSAFAVCRIYAQGKVFACSALASACCDTAVDAAATALTMLGE